MQFSEDDCSQMSGRIPRFHNRRGAYNGHSVMAKVKGAFGTLVKP